MVMNVVLIIILGYIAIKDLREMIVPNKALIALLLVGLINLCVNVIDVEKITYSFLVSSFIFCGLYYLGKNIIGAGDVKLVMVLSLWLEFPHNLLAWWIAFTLGGLTGIFLMIMRKYKFKAKIPFAPMLIMGMLLSYFYGKNLWDWWQNLICGI